MLHTAEVRWFYAGDLPAHILDWFCAGRQREPQERTDRYLIFPGCESVGVKMREGMFEIKALRGASEVVRYPGNVVGRSDGWVKWSVALPAHGDWNQVLQADQPDWIDVTKVRRQRQFALEDQQVFEVPLEQTVATGATVELTHITARARTWWSVALEAPGEPALVRMILQHVAEHFFARHPLREPFDTIHSCAYPVWLASLVLI